MKRMMLVGKVGSGKTTLTQRLCNTEIRYDKTQTVEFHDYIIDTPGEYLENRVYFKGLVVSSYDADVIVLIESMTNDVDGFSFGFANMFNKPVYGLITKIDLVNDDEVLERAKQRLLQAGAQEIFVLGFNEKDELPLFIEALQGGNNDN